MSELREQMQRSLGAAYTIERELGGGGMSRVFVANESALGRAVVIKVIAPGLLEGISADRFTREVKLAARLQQANIVPLLNAGDASGTPYYTMPFVDGLSLRARIANGTSISLAEAMHVLRDVAKALAYAHGQGVVHRDIKPENVLLSGGTAMVTDFGIAKALTASRTQDGSEPLVTAVGTLTSAGSSLGTPAYMAPEQAVGSTVDLRADLYAWGVMAYELLTGAHVFAGRTTAQQLVAAHIAETPAPIATKNASIPSALAAAVMRCLEKDPARRPASAAELLAALDETTTPNTVATPNPGASTGTSRAALAVGVAAVLVVAAVSAWTYARREGATVDATASASADKTLAVIPFASVGGDTANAYFAEGIADELTTALARVPGLRLAGRNSAARFKGKGASAPEVGKALDVSSVLDGTVRRAGDRVRVTAELTSAADGRVLWQETFERRAQDVFAVQDEIAGAIASALQVRLGTATPDGSTASRGTKDFDAYDLYLRGLQLFRRRGQGMRDAEAFFDRAIARDSMFARAYAAKSLNLLIGSYFLNRRMSEALPPARRAAERALALDPSLAEAHMAMAQVHVESFEWVDAEAEGRRAVSLNPALSEALYRLGFTLLNMGRLRESVTWFERARQIDPLWGTNAVYLGLVWTMIGRVDEGVAEAQRGLAIDPTLESAQTIVAFTLVTSGRLREAAEHSVRVAALTTDTKRLGVYSYAMLRGGHEAEGIALRQRLLGMPPNTWGVHSALVTSSLGARDTAGALAAMEAAAAGDGDLLLSIPLGMPMFDELRTSPRFAAVVRRFNLDVARLTKPDGGRSQ